MSVFKTTDEYDSFIKSTNNENEDNNFIIKYLILSIPRGVFLLLLLVYF